MKRLLTLLSIAPLFYSAFSMAEPETLPKPDTIHDACQEIVLFGGMFGSNDEAAHEDNRKELAKIVSHSVEEWGFDDNRIKKSAIKSAKNGYKTGMMNQRRHDNPAAIDKKVTTNIHMCMSSLGDLITGYQNNKQPILKN